MASAFAAAHRLLRSGLKIRDCRFSKICAAVVVGENVRLGLRDVWIALPQRLRDLAVIVLPSAPNQRLVGGILNQRMLKSVACEG